MSDQVGTPARITPERILAALRLPTRGRMVNLSHTLENGMPVPDFHGPFLMTTHRTVRGTLDMYKEANENRLGSIVCRYELADHTGTHIDALNHASEGFELYGGLDAREVTTDTGTTALGVDTLPPIVTRGVLADIPSYLGVQTLDDGYEITEKDIAGALRSQGLSLHEGDALLIRTGFSRFWMVDNARYLGYSPGVGTEAAEWIAEQRVSVTGADNSSYDVVKRGSSKLFPCHQILLKRAGIPLVENLVLEELSAMHVTQFLFVCTPLRFRGGAGSPVTPVALF
jgi:kynurenine formamidase